MDLPIPPDPYNALGLSKSATSAEIKKAYRQLALRLHPDKCTDETQKATNIDAFHKVQQAYDLVGDEDNRARYDAQIRLAELRRQNLELRNESVRGSTRAGAYDVRTAAPREASYTASRDSPRGGIYDERRARDYYYDEAPRATSRKTTDYEYANVKRSSPPRDRERDRERERDVRERERETRDRERERVRVSERETEDRRRSARTREAEVRDSRSRKYDTRDDYRRDQEYEDARKKATEARKTETYAYPVAATATSPSTSSAAQRPAASTTQSSSTQREMDDKMRDALRHQQARSRPAAVERPSSYRTTSTRDVPHVYEDAYSARRSAAAPKEKDRSRRTSPGKENDRKAPPLTTHASSPATMEVPHPPNRSYTAPVHVDPPRKKSKDFSPPPISRSATMPMPVPIVTPASSSRRKESVAGQSSRLRHSATASPTEAYTSPTEAYTKTQYRYPEPSAAPLRTESGNTSAYSPRPDYKAVLREPGATTTRPVSNTAAKMANLDPYRSAPQPRATSYAYPEAASVRPSLQHTSSARVVPAATRSSRSPERGSRRSADRYAEDSRRAPSSTKLYGERTPSYTSSARAQPTSYRQDEISYSPRIDPKDIVYAAGKASSRGRDRGSDDFVKPSMQRSTTYAY